jgi:hypothetical protein
MTKLKVDFDEIAVAMENRNQEMTFYLDLNSGEVVMVSYEYESALEEIIKTIGENVVNQKNFDLEAALLAMNYDEGGIELLVEAFTVKRGAGKRFLEIPSLSSRLGFKDMEDFVETVRDQRWRARLMMALSESSPFRKFKEALAANQPERQRWFKFKDDRMHLRVVSWLEEVGIEYL